MGSCFSKGSHPNHRSTPTQPCRNQSFKCSSNAQSYRKEINHQSNHESVIKRKEVFVIKHRKSHHNERIPHSSPLSRSNEDAFQRGSLSRSHSAAKIGATAADQGIERIRAFASRERIGTHSQEIQATGSSERRVSRSPARRMDCNLAVEPFKMITATGTDKTSSSTQEASSTVTRISVKRHAGGGSPRSLSPSECNRRVCSYRKTSPNKRAPLSEIETAVDQKQKSKEIAEVKKGGYEQEHRQRSVNKSYTALLLQDIENFHQKSAAMFTSPAYLTKAKSIVEEVADLNSTTRCEAKKQNKERDLFVESEVEVLDDLMEPSLQKYVTCRRRCARDGEESSGSNSICGGRASNSVDRRIQLAKIPVKVLSGKDDRFTVGNDANIQSRYMEAVAIL